MRLAAQARAAMLAITAVAAAAAAGPGSATAALEPHWVAISIPAPTWFHAGDFGDVYEVAALNDGGTATSGEISLADTLPPGVTVAAVTGAVSQAIGEPGIKMPCTESSVEKVVTVNCKTSTSVPVGRFVEVKISVNVPHAASGTLSNSATISGGGASSATAANATPVAAAAETAPFGVSAVSDLVNADGTPDVQAGSHPYAYTTLLAYNSAGVNVKEKCGAELAGGSFWATPGCATQAGAPRSAEVTLPPGMVGDPSAVPRCSAQQFQLPGFAECAPETQVGVVEVGFYNSEYASNQIVPVYNIVPPPGQPAELGFTVSTIGHVTMLFHVRPLSSGGYALTATVSNITQFLNVHELAMTIWGVPAEESHTSLRMSSAEGAECGPSGGLDGGCISHAAHDPFLTLPTSCPGDDLSVAIGVDSWQRPLSAPLPTSFESLLPGMGGCETLSLGEPSIEIAPDTRQAGVPSGYGVHLTVPQQEEPEETATPDIRDVEVVMPEGTVVSPSAANGLLACTMRSEPGAPEGEFGLNSETQGKCPSRSEIGKVKITSPLIEEPITGKVYVGEPECSPCTAAQIEEGKMVHLLIEATLANPNEAEMSQAEREAYRPPVLIKLAGHTKIDRRTGRLTTVFSETPQLPFSELELELENGPTAPLVNPSTCGPIAASAHLTAWSALFDGAGKVTDPGSEASISSPPVSIEGCSAHGFSPTFAAGMTTNQRGGAFSSFAVTLTRPDGQQTLGTVTMHMPTGLAGMLSKVQLCGEPQADEGTCPASSQIGTTVAVVGPGSEPYAIGGGRVYLTGPYGGGPFGLSIIVPAEAGPFHLAGLTGAGSEGSGSVVVRGSIKVDPKTAAITIATGALPTQLDGIPLDVQKVIVEVNRPGFMFNATNCDKMSITGTISSSAGAAANVSYPYQAVKCASLRFAPGFKVVTRAKHTRRGGAYLRVNVTSSQGQANIKSVRVKLPKALASRDETLNQACSEKQFAANPAGCPKGSFVGTAVARTPVLPVPLTGPAIFVSHGGAAFPDLDVVLQGDGVTVDLTGNTNIVKNITISNFKSVPDVPVSNFQLTLPTGPHSALAANGNLCTKTVMKRMKANVHGHVVFRKRRIKRKLTLSMPTTIAGQNGGVIKRNTVIKVEGCGKAAKKKRHRK